MEEEIIMVTKPTFNIKTNQRIIIFFVSAIIIIVLAILFLQVGTSSLGTRTGLIIFMIAVVIAIIVIYKTIKSFSIKFAVDMR